MKVLIVYYSMFGHVYKLAKAAAEGVSLVDEAEAILLRIPETLSKDVLEKTGVSEIQEPQENIPICTINNLKEADAIIFGTPTRFGNMCGQMRQFLDATGKLWADGALVGKVGSVITSTSTQHGGQESTILSFHITLLHHGMIIVGLPYSFKGQMTMDEISGCSPYGASTIAGGDGSIFPNENELAGARYQGEHVAKIARKITAG